MFSMAYKNEKVLSMKMVWDQCVQILKSGYQ